MDLVNKKNMGFLTDLYELTMCASYLESGKEREVATFDLFIRKLPPNRSYFVFAGLEQALYFLEKIRFWNEQLNYLEKEGFKEEFLKYLQDFRFTGNVSAVPEGTIVFPNEPLIKVTAPIIEAQIVETFLLNCVNLQTMIASKASRIVEAAQGRPVVDFGLRRCHGTDAGMKAARASFIAGCNGTSNVLAAWKYDIPAVGTMAHSFVQAFPKEIDAFRAFASSFPKKSTFLIDTYDTIQGARNAAKVAKEMSAKGLKLRGVRLDSGDLEKLSKRVRYILDKEGLSHVEIVASGDLDEYKIRDLINHDATIDTFGVGTQMDTSSDQPYVDVVYKLSEIIHDGTSIPVMKLSEGKLTLPGRKNTFRQRRVDGKYQRDVIGLEDEKIDGVPLLQPVMKNGQTIYDPSLLEIRKNAQKNLQDLPEPYKQLDHAIQYPIELSGGLKRLLKKTSIELEQARLAR